jgi:phospholipase A1
MLLTGTILQPPDAVANAIKDCMVNALETADPSTTISALRFQCENKTSQEKTDVKSDNVEEVHLVEDRIQKDKEHILQPFTLMAHKPSYLLIASYNSNGYDTVPWREELSDSDFKDWEDIEAQFQLSVKFPLLVNLFDNTFDIYAAYTNRSFWQIYYEDSAPFRETNHEPEMWVQFNPNWEIFGVKNTWNSFGINHQSNGRGGGLSRSWNRLFAWITFEKGSLAFSFKPWYRLPEDSENDDNPDITDYLGHFEFSTSYKWRDHVFSLMSRNNLESGFTKGAVELSWSFPLGDWPYLKGYVQYFNGYGRSLIDYNQRANVIGAGISLIDWL